MGSSLDIMRPGQCGMVDFFRHETGHEVRNNDGAAFYYRSREICLNDEPTAFNEIGYMYLEERRNGNEQHVGYGLSFCLIDEDFPEKLTEEGDNIVKYFDEFMRNPLMFWEKSASIGNAYTRGFMDPLKDNRFDGPRCLWVNFGSSQRDLRDYTPHVFNFKEAARNFDIGLIS